MGITLLSLVHSLACSLCRSRWQHLDTSAIAMRLHCAMTFISLSNSFITNLSQDKSVSLKSNVRPFFSLSLSRLLLRMRCCVDGTISSGVNVSCYRSEFCFYAANEKYARVCVSVCNAILLMMRSHMQMRVKKCRLRVKCLSYTPNGCA